MAKSVFSAKTLFFRGDYQNVLALTLDNPRARWKSEDLGYIIGSLTFVGRCEEAEILFEKHLLDFTQEQRIEGRFFLGLGFSRRSDYARARRYFGANRREARKRLSQRMRFYVFQGLAFYRYFCGKWKAALRDSKISFEAALRADYLLGRALSSDLRGHLLVQMGFVQQGLKVLRQAQELATQTHNQAVNQAIEISRIAYEAQFGLDPSGVIERLSAYVESIGAIQDTYSLSKLLLELARQHLLRGNFLEARAVLERAAQQIYSHQNRRQEVTLQLRYAYLDFLSGESARGLSQLQAAKRALDPVVDHELALSVLGMEHKLLSGLNLATNIEELARKLVGMSCTYGGAVNRRILERQKMIPQREQPRNEDRLGLVKDRLRAEPGQAIEIALQSGYHAFLLDLLPSARGRQIIYLDLGEDSLTVFDRDGITHSPGLTPLLRSLLVEISSGACSKERLIETVWRYRSYHPLSHDPVIYQAVANLRKLFGRRADWIQTMENGYQLRPGVELRSQRPREISRAVPFAAIESAPVINSTYHQRLNFRQVRFLRDAKPREFMTVHDYQRSFKVSEITACRDLALLSQLGLVVKVGRARATRYVLAAGGAT